MQALLLSAGESSRMYPLSNGYHKSMIKLLGKPILEHTIEKLKKKQITDLIIVVNKDNNIQSYFGSGEKFGVSIKYVIQEKANGMGNAILLSQKYINGDFLLLNSYHVEVDRFIDKLLSAKTQKTDSVLLVKKREDVSSYGVVLVKNKQVEGVIEKPDKEKETSKLSIIGIYLLSKNFVGFLSKTPSEHYQLESALNMFVKNNSVAYVETKEDTVVLKYPWHLLGIKNYLLKSIKSHRGNNIKIAENVLISGNVCIEDDVTILEGACIKGPCYLGKGSYMGSNSLLRGGIDLGEKAVVGSYMEINDSILMERSTTHSGFIGNSIIGEDVKIGTQFATANVRLDRNFVNTFVKGEKVNTGLKHLGLIIGNNSRIGLKVSSMPGVIIGSNVIIGPSTVVMQNVLDNKKYYTKFKEIVYE